MNAQKGMINLLRESEIIQTVNLIQFFTATIIIKSKTKKAYLAIISHQHSKSEKAYSLHSLFIFQQKEIYHINGKLRILIVYPLTVEINFFQRTSGFSFQWLTHSDTQIEIQSEKASYIMVHLSNIVQEGGRYQRQPFHSNSCIHKWIWFYQQFIPRAVRELDEQNLKYFENRETLFLKSDHYNNQMMENYINHQLLKRKTQFTTQMKVKMWVGTWNIGGSLPSRSLKDWIKVQSEVPDLFCFNLQEICELSAKNIRGNDQRKNLWVSFILSQLKKVYPRQEFFIVKQKCLVGLLLVICAKIQVKFDVKNVCTSKVKLGFRGMVGNKGAVSLSFQLYDSDFCVINCHLAAHKRETRVRNKNIKSIIKLTRFQTGQNQQKNLYQHDFIIWAGDFNYRINLTGGQIIDLIERKNIYYLSIRDQFVQQRVRQKLLRDFQQSKVNFLPTYKFYKNSNTYNQSRQPAWCDRILFKGNMKTLAYKSCSQIINSDHKPVYTIFSLEASQVNKSLKERVRNKIIQQIQLYQKKNESDILLSTRKISFRNLKYKYPCHQSLKITNTGNLPAEIELKVQGESLYSSYVIIDPTKSFLQPNESIWIYFTAFVQQFHAQIANNTKGALNFNILMFEKGAQAERVNSIQIQVKSKFNGSCFGSTIQQLVRLEKPIFFYPYHIKDAIRESVTDIGTPKELTRIFSFIQQHATQPNLFYLTGSRQVISEIRLCLDSGDPFPDYTDVFSMCQVLLEFLQSLANPLVSPHILDEAVECNSFQQSSLFLSQSIGNLYERTFVFLINFLKHLSTLQTQNELSPQSLAKSFIYPLTQDNSTQGLSKENRLKFLIQLIKE